MKGIIAVLLFLGVMIVLEMFHFFDDMNGMDIDYDDKER